MKSTIIGMFVLMAFGMFMSRPEISKAADDDVLNSLANYKSWGRITKEPYTVNSFPNGTDLRMLSPGSAPTGEFQIDLRAVG
jgi:hypothetical protein